MNAVEYDESVEKVASVIWSYIDKAEEYEIYPLAVDAVKAIIGMPKDEWEQWLSHIFNTYKLTEDLDCTSMAKDAYEAIKDIRYPKL